MNLNEHHLIVLMEECAEVIHRASKQLRFGADEIQPGQAQTNRDRLRGEILDVFATVEFLIDSGQIDPIEPYDVREHMKIKRQKVEAMWHLSRDQGCLTLSEGTKHD